MRTKQQKRLYSKDWFQKNKKRESLKRSIYNKQNHLKINLWRQKRRKTPEGHYSYLKIISKRRNKKFSLIREEFVVWWKKQGSRCCYCLREFSYDKKEGTSPSVDRLNNNEGYEIENIVLCCELCNRVKNIYFSQNEMVQIGKIISNIFKKRNVDYKRD